MHGSKDELQIGLVLVVMDYYIDFTFQQQLRVGDAALQTYRFPAEVTTAAHQQISSFSFSDQKSRVLLVHGPSAGIPPASGANMVESASWSPTTGEQQSYYKVHFD